MPTKQCPRCKDHLDDRFFQEPVKLCMVCYGQNPGNDAIRLSLPALRAKARRSRFAKVRSNRQDRDLILAALDESAASLQAFQVVNSTPGDQFMATCDGPCRMLLSTDVLKPNNRKVPGARPNLDTPFLCDECAILATRLSVEEFAAQFYNHGVFDGHEETEEETEWKLSHFSSGMKK
jgi:hypothetical protein